MQNDTLALIKTCSLFSSLEDNACLDILSECQTTTLNHNEILFQQGDSSDCLYIVASGQLTAFLTTNSGAAKIIGHIQKGEVVGELGALSDQPRTLTVKANETTTLLKLTTEAFKKLSVRYPAILVGIISPLITRSQNTIKLLAEEKNAKHLAIIPANSEICLAQFKNSLQQAISANSGILLLNDSDHTENNLKEKTSLSANTHHTLIYLCSQTESPFMKLALEKADTIFVVGNQCIENNCNTAFLNNLRSQQKRLELILLYPDADATPGNTKNWLNKIDFFQHHHIRLHKHTDYARLLRFMTGTAIGVVLGGGGAKGWVHLGVIKALLEKDIPIDAIGGSSIGAVAAGCFAMHETYTEMLESFRTVIKTSSSPFAMRNFTWPIISLIDSKHATAGLQKVYADTSIENLWLPYFCMSCNLSTHQEAIHQRGLLWEKIRSSASLPGIVPPMVIDGQLHFDGGLLNNLPIDVMRNRLGVNGKIIGVSLLGGGMDKTIYNFPPVLTFKQAFLAKLGLCKNNYKFPPFFDTFLTSLLMGSSSKEKQNALIADLLIAPELTGFRMLDLNSKQETKLIEIGYNATLDAINKVD